MHSRMEEQRQSQQQFREEPTPKTKQPQVNPDDYIEFEEVK